MSTEKFLEPPVEILESWGKSGPVAEKEALEGIKHLWKLDDPEWVEKRDQDWKLIQENVFPDTPKKERKIYENYFKIGELDGYAAGIVICVLTPYTNSNEFKQLLTSQLVVGSERERVYSQYIYLMSSYEVCDWYKSHMEIATESLLGKKYIVIKEFVSSQDQNTLSPSPSSWVRNFSSSIMEGLRNDKWVPSYACVDYFITILPYALKEKFRKKVRLDVLYELIDEGLMTDGFSYEAKLFAEEMIAKKAEVFEAWEIGEQKIAAQSEKS